MNLPAALELRLKQLGIHEEDLVETFARASGPGGQNVNKVASAVTLTHRPSGITVYADTSRSQQTNRVLARERLADQLEKKRAEQKQKRAEATRKKRLQKSKRPKGVQERILRAKKNRGQLKKLRSEKFH